jgi:hypothetical protein
MACFGVSRRIRDRVEEADAGLSALSSRHSFLAQQSLTCIDPRRPLAVGPDNQRGLFVDELTFAQPATILLNNRFNRTFYRPLLHG